MFSLQTVNADYRCLCFYGIETSVYAESNINSAVIGYLYEFDCKPLFQGINSTDSGFTAVHFENKVSPT